MTNSKPREFIGRYRIIKLLGRGAMGQVYLAHDPKIDRLVAIKTIIQDAAIPDAEREENKVRFLREAQAAGKLLHPAIVTIFDVAEEEGEMYIAMEYIEGEPLDIYCEKGSLIPHARVLEYVRQAAEGLDYAHKYQVVHRDIKPANLMAVEGKTLKITDFGLAKNPSTSITMQGMLVGTPNYMSPEQIQGHELDGRSDLFSLGVVMYELLTGERPFKGKSISTVIYKIMHDPAPSLNEVVPSLPPAYDKVVQKALAKATADRFASGAEFAAAIKAILERPGAAPAAPPPPSLAIDQGAATRIEPRPGLKESPPSRAGATGAMPGLPELTDSNPPVRRKSAPAPFAPTAEKRGGGAAWWIAGLLLVGGGGALFWKLKQPGPVTVAASAPDGPASAPVVSAPGSASAPAIPPGSDPAPGSVPDDPAGSAPASTPAGSAPAPAPVSAPDSAPGSAPASVPAAITGQVLVSGGNWTVSVKGRKGSYRAGNSFSLPEGKYTLQLSWPDLFATATRPVTVEANRVAEVRVGRPATGTVKVVSRPEAKIYIDNAYVDNTPLTKEIAVGRHTITAKDAETGETWDKQSITVHEGANEPLNFRAPE